MTQGLSYDAGDSALRPGQEVAGRFVVEQVLGSGATGTVYRARRTEDDRVVALKVVHRHLCNDRQVFGRYMREAKILSHMEGDHIAQLLEVVEHDGLVTIALEHVDGESLEAALARRGPFNPPEAVEIALQVCRALGTAHARGVVHRDLKPGNVLLERQSTASSGALDWKRVRVVDFGLAKIVQEDLTTTGLTEQDMIFGTAEYMSPEQARGEDADARADIYALGVMLYEMLVGKVPLTENTAIATMTAHLTREPEPPRRAAPERSISSELEAVILKALSKRPEDRYPTARSLAEALSVAGERTVVSSAPPAAPVAPQLGTADTNLHLEELTHSATLPYIDDGASRLATPGPPAPAPLQVRSSAPADAPSSSRFLLVFAAVALVAMAIGAYLAMR